MAISNYLLSKHCKPKHKILKHSIQLLILRIRSRQSRMLLPTLVSLEMPKSHNLRINVASVTKICVKCMKTKACKHKFHKI